MQFQSWIKSLQKEQNELEAKALALKGAIVCLRTAGSTKSAPARAAFRSTHITPPGRGRSGPALARKAAHGRTNAPRGLLSEKIHQVLGKSAHPMPPGILCKAVIKAGYPVKNPRTLYTQIFAAAKKDPRISKTHTGFALRKRG